LENWRTTPTGRNWPVRDTRRAELNDRNRGIAAVGGAKLNGSKGSKAPIQKRLSDIRKV
jgi:hypothetical protein